MLLTPGRGADLTLAAARLDAIARAHGAIAHPLVPPVTARRTLAGRPVLELASDAAVDGVELVRRLARTGTRIPYASADGFIVSLRTALQAAHATRDVDGRPRCLGRISAANVLFAESGRWYLVGFGANFPLDDERAVPDGDTAYCEAPELAFGGPPSPDGDYLAVLLFARSLLGHLDAPGPIARLLRAAAEPRDAPLAELLRRIEQRLFAELPGRRATMAEGIALNDRVRALLGVRPDPAGFERLAARLLATPPDDARDASAARAVTVGPEAAWIARGDGAPRALRGGARRVALALLEHHLLGATSPLRSVDLVERGWPTEHPTYESGLNRVYVTVNRLKKVFPEGSVERFDDGYRLSPDLVVRRRDA